MGAQMREARFFRVALVIAVWGLGQAAVAQGPERARPLDGWLYGRGDAPYEADYWGNVMSGRSPSMIFPLFGAELSRAESSLDWSESDPRLRLSLGTPTFCFDTPYTDSSAISSPPSPTLPELQRAMQSLPSPLELDLGLSVGKSLSITSDIGLYYRRDRFTGTGSTLAWDAMTGWGEGLVGNIEFPRKAWVAYGTEGFGVAFGRFPAGIGAGHFGSLVLNSEALYYDQAFFHLGTDRLRFAWMLGTSSAQLSASEADVQWRHNSEGSSYWDTESDHDYSASQNALKLFAYHTLEYLPWERLRIGLTEFAVMGGTTPSLNYLLPTLSWHNTYSAGYSNVAMAVMASCVPVDGLLLSGQFLLDDTQGSDEAANSKPGAYAWQASAVYATRPAQGALVTVGAEYNHVDRWTYVRWQPYLSMYQRQILPGGYHGIDLPLGFAYGPDCDQGGVWAEYRDASGASLKFSYELVFKGPIYMGMVNEIDNLLTTGSPSLESIPVYYDYDTYAGPGGLEAILARPDEIRNIFALSGSVPFAKGLDAMCSVSLGFYQNYGNESGVYAHLVVVYLGVRWRPLSAGVAR